METQQTINARAERVERALNEAFGVKAKSLGKALRKTGRRLPKRLRSEAELIVAAQGLGGHPKLIKRVDGGALDAAEARVSAYLKTVDRAEARKTRLLSMAAAIAFNILLIAGGFVAWMVWTGRI
ncbi:hypothetical protein [Tateyamaria pelophila]|uniref:hypothetical protein n=1 Tax=Tateyamaria pelophila TaxID=328415 RepID=UPI001CBB2988|nr:hypothetical protein [Tateyamaria pelophila]